MGRGAPRYLVNRYSGCVCKGVSGWSERLNPWVEGVYRSLWWGWGLTQPAGSLNRTKTWVREASLSGWLSSSWDVGHPLTDLHRGLSCFSGPHGWTGTVPPGCPSCWLKIWGLLSHQSHKPRQFLTINPSLSLSLPLSLYNMYMPWLIHSGCQEKPSSPFIILAQWIRFLFILLYFKSILKHLQSQQF